MNCTLWRESDAYYSRFRLRCDQADLKFTDSLQFHTLESPKFHWQAVEILQCSPVEKWPYILQHAEHSDAEELSELLGEPVFDEAVGVLKMISQTPEERQHYEARQKFLLDEEARMSGACQEGIEQGLELGRSEGMLVGIEKGTLAGRIQVLQQLLGEEETGTAALTGLAVDELSSRVQRLQDRLRQRDQT